MAHKKWVRISDPEDKYTATFTCGNRDDELPANFIVSMTLGENFNIPRMMINGLITQMIMKQIAKRKDIYFAELYGGLKKPNLTITVFDSGKEMKSFRDSGAHKFAKKFFSWVFYSGNVQSYFLTFKTNKIPTTEEGIELCRTFGRHFDGGKLIRQASQPENVSK